MSPKKSKLDPALKSQWVAELRSGKYKQGKGRLKKKDRYNDDAICHCCLGVLCEILEPEGFKVKETSLEYGTFQHSFGGKTYQESYPNQAKLREIGLFPSTYKRLAQLNDGESHVENGKWVSGRTHSFEEIADYIEENL